MCISYIHSYRHHFNILFKILILFWLQHNCRHHKGENTYWNSTMYYTRVYCEQYSHICWKRFRSRGRAVGVGNHINISFSTSQIQYIYNVCIIFSTLRFLRTSLNLASTFCRGFCWWCRYYWDTKLIHMSQKWGGGRGRGKWHHILPMNYDVILMTEWNDTWCLKDKRMLLITTGQFLESLYREESNIHYFLYIIDIVFYMRQTINHMAF